MTRDIRLSRSTRLEIDLDRIGANFDTVRSLLKGTDTAVACVLKANAYGHGTLRVAGELVSRGAPVLAVALLGEALELRKHFMQQRILVMGHTPDHLLQEAVDARIELTVFKPSQIPLLSAAAAATRQTAVVHIKLDTGMNRLGLKESDDPVGFAKALAAAHGVRIEGLFTHLALRDHESDKKQAESFFHIASAIGAAGIDIPCCHICDSIGFLRYPHLRLDMVRLGAILFGMKPLKPQPEIEALDLAPALAYRSAITRIRHLSEGECVSYDRSWVAPPQGASVATVATGYADGYLRCLSNRAQVLVHGHRAPVVGLVCMDQLTVDVSHVPHVQEGDDVLLLGGGGSGAVGVAELAAWAGTNRNEIMTALSRRIPRLYFKGGAPVAVEDAQY